jgi:zinc/manganese transport system permease protein
MDALELLWPALAVGLVLAGIHAWLGLHVLARGVIFVDLALAQVAALGAALATLAGHPSHGGAAYFYSLAFALGGAALLALTRTRSAKVPQEALIGVVYVVAAAAVVLVLDRSPEGAERVKGLLVGDVLAVGPAQVGRLGLLYGAIGAGHWLCRRALLDLSHGLVTDPRRALAWDLVFYASFAVVVTSSVRVAGVLLVFAYLVVPAAVGMLVAERVGARLAVAWLVGAGATGAGLGASLAFDLPTGAAVVVALGAALAVALALRAALGAPGRRRESLARAGRAAASAAGAALAAAGLLLALFPGWNHVWLTALERPLPALETLFLTDGEREVRADTLRTGARNETEIARLTAMRDAVRLGDLAMDEARQERLRQFLLGRQEIAAGERFVLARLRERARNRQRFVLGLPLAGFGAAVVWWAMGLGRVPR